MNNTVIMTKGNCRCEIFPDKAQTLGRCHGKGNYIVRRSNKKYQRVESMLAEYKHYKRLGYRVERIF